VNRTRRVTLMPAIALAALGLMVALPTLSGVRLYAATAPRYQTVVVKPGDTLWSIASSYGAANTDIQETIDRITEANHLHAPSLQPGEKLRIPE
jgi:LysM repeat protein